MSKPIWFPFYANDFLSSSKVAVLSTEEIGAYVLLLCHAWQDPTCSLPHDDEKLSKLGRIKTDMTALKECFTVKKGRLVNERLYTEWLKANENKEVASRNGHNGAIKRWHTKAIATPLATPLATPMANEWQNDSSSPSPSPSPSNIIKIVKNTPADKKIAAGKVEALGAETWEAYRAAYHHRYRVDPVRNHQLNSHLKKLVELLGAVESPQVAAFYLSCSQQLYINSRHPTTLLIRDYAALRTQMATGNKVTRMESKSEEQKDNVMEQFKRITDMKKKPIDITPPAQGVIDHD